ncbi:OLC1v1025406C1 [Oldenlandia corymbosa var. corymbosa]|uniref:OLC1v1025406C1 n=1 Tax=Oldenlandia corymbosa var. corymbosa TaxID=529605 RepID=A0AAV1C7P8_OLDCO|nr:OLC1v1025406C1 [Oldenlandia corymbosa var. corymbosa]
MERLDDDGSSIAGVDVTTRTLDDLRIQAPVDGKGGYDAGSVQITNFSEFVEDVTLHFQIIRLQKQLYAWIGCNSARFGHLVAAAPTRPFSSDDVQSNAVSVAQLVGRSTDNTGAGIARRVGDDFATVN